MPCRVGAHPTNRPKTTDHDQPQLVDSQSYVDYARWARGECGVRVASDWVIRPVPVAGRADHG